MPITLFSYPTSPYGMKVGCFLVYKKLDFKFVAVNPITNSQIAHTKQAQIPVLKIGSEWKKDSTEIGVWLDQQFPQQPLLRESQLQYDHILFLNKWVSERLIPHQFRQVVEWPSLHRGLMTGWRLASAIHQNTPLPAWARFFWPLMIRRAPFITAMLNDYDRSVRWQQQHQNLIEEFLHLLDVGPFLGGFDQPTLADLSAYPILVFGYEFNLEGYESWFMNETILRWYLRVKDLLSDNPLLIKRQLLPRRIPTYL
jgi:glutathione S-transferase